MPLPRLAKTRYTNIKKDPQGRFWTDFTVRGKRKRVLCGDLRTARDFVASRLEKNRRAELFPDEALKQSGASLSLADLANRFQIELEGRVKEKTVKSYQNSDRHLKKFFGDQPAFSIEVHQCHQFRREREARGAAVASVNRDLERLRLLLNLAVRDRLMARSPIEGYRILESVENRIRYLTADEEARLKEWCFENDPELWTMIEFSIFTGLRAREQWTLTWDRVMPEYIRVKRPKTSTRDHLPIRRTVAGILEQQKGKHEKWVWPGEGAGPVDHDNFSKRRFKPALKAAGVHNLRWHDLRHTFCSRLVSKGVDLYTVMSLAGHSSIETTRQYAHLSPHKLSSALDVLEGPDEQEGV
jgi:integrase